MGLTVKICGLTERENALRVVEAGADAIGFNFWPRSRRFIAPEALAPWVGELPDGVTRVGLFVDAPPGDVARVMNELKLDVAQLHGKETAEEAEGLPGRVWKVVHLERTTREELSRYRVDAFLVDSYSPDAPGGTGLVGDWDAARALVEASSTPVMLAGGLTPENVGEAVRTVRPWGVDVSSGVESAPGIKDIERVKRFIEACRNS